MVAWLCMAFAAPTLDAADPPSQSGLRIAGYLPDYRMADFDVESATGLTDLILFSAEPGADGDLDLRRLRKCPWERLLEYKT